MIFLNNSDVLHGPIATSFPIYALVPRHLRGSGSRRTVRCPMKLPIQAPHAEQRPGRGHMTQPSAATCCLLVSLPSSASAQSFPFKRKAWPSGCWSDMSGCPGSTLVSQQPESCQIASGLYRSTAWKSFSSPHQIEAFRVNN